LALKSVDFEKGKRYPFFLCDIKQVRYPKGNSLELTWKSIDNGYTIKQRFTLSADNVNTFALNEMIRLTSGNKPSTTKPDDYFVLGMKILSGVHRILTTSMDGKYVYVFDPDTIMPYAEKVEEGASIRKEIVMLLDKKLERKVLLQELQAKGSLWIKEFRKLESEGVV